MTIRYGTTISLELPPDTAFEIWVETGRKLAKAANAIQWWWGDWWAFGETRYGQRISQLSESGCPLAPETLMNYAVVCRRFEPSRRREVLSFSHHQVVAPLPAAEAGRLLDWAAETIPTQGRPRSVKELRDECERRSEKITHPTPASPPENRVITVSPDHGPSQLVATSPSHSHQLEPAIALDPPKASEPVPPQLEALRDAPSPAAIDHAAIAVAFAKLEFEQALAVIKAWFKALPRSQQAAACTALDDIRLSRRLKLR
jgi:hypothetical protein